jgi:aminomethyltransferase
MVKIENKAHKTIKKTPLNPEHKLLNAEMINFYDWEMPIHYGSQIQEHHNVRENCGVFDVSHMGIVDITGPDAKQFLRYLLANDIDKCTDNSAMYTCMLNDNGGIIDDLITYKINSENYRLVINASRVQEDLTWIREQVKNKHKFNTQITQINTLAIIALQGPNSSKILSEIINPETMGVINQLKPFQLTQYKAWIIARTGYTGEDGFEIMIPDEQAGTIWNSLIEHGAKPCGLGARDTLRLEAGLNLYGKDMTESTSPLCTNLKWTINWKDETRNFIGKDALRKESLDDPQEKLVGLYLKGKGVLRDGQIIFLKEEPCGIITSGGFSPSLNNAIAFARIKFKSLENNNANFTPEFCVKIRNKMMPVILVKPPFIKKGKKNLNLIFESDYIAS